MVLRMTYYLFGAKGKQDLGALQARLDQMRAWSMPADRNEEPRMAQLGKLLTGIIAVSSRLTLAELGDIATRPARHVCLICGREPQDPYGTALGAACKQRAKDAGMRVASMAGEKIGQLTILDLAEIVLDARARGISSESDPLEQPPNQK
jgi:hypothetical protein